MATTSSQPSGDWAYDELLNTSYTSAPYSARVNATLGGSEPNRTKSLKLTFTAAGNMLGASQRLAAAVAFIVAAI